MNVSSIVLESVSIHIRPFQSPNRGSISGTNVFKNVIHFSNFSRCKTGFIHVTTSGYLRIQMFQSTYHLKTIYLESVPFSAERNWSKLFSKKKSKFLLRIVYQGPEIYTIIVWYRTEIDSIIRKSVPLSHTYTSRVPESCFSCSSWIFKVYLSSKEIEN